MGAVQLESALLHCWQIWQSALLEITQAQIPLQSMKELLEDHYQHMRPCLTDSRQLCLQYLHLVFLLCGPLIALGLELPVQQVVAHHL